MVNNYREGIFYLSLENAVITVSREGDKKEQFVINLPNVRKLQPFLKGFWDFTAYQTAFPGRSKLSDVDGSIELNGHTLHIEFKESKWAMTQGQVLKAIRQAKHSKITTIFVIGKTDHPTIHLIFSPDHPEGEGYQDSSVEILLEVFRKWADWTKENSLVGNRTAEWDAARQYC